MLIHFLTNIANQTDQFISNNQKPIQRPMETTCMSHSLTHPTQFLTNYFSSPSVTPSCPHTPTLSLQVECRSWNISGLDFYHSRLHSSPVTRSHVCAQMYVNILTQFMFIVNNLSAPTVLHALLNHICLDFFHIIWRSAASTQAINRVFKYMNWCICLD